jgi:hypothetical protein
LQPLVHGLQDPTSFNGRMNNLAGKAKLVALGALATFGWQRVFLHVEPAPTVASPIRPMSPSKVETLVVPTIDLSVLDRLQHVGAAGRRDLFRFAASTPAAKPPVARQRNAAEPASDSTTTGPPAIEIQARRPVFYGYGQPRGSAPLAFLLNDDEIYVMKAGEIMHGSYRIIGFDLTSVTIENSLTGDRQTVPILEPL